MNMNPGRTEVLGEHATNPPNPSAGGTTIATGWCDKCRKPIVNELVGAACQRCDSLIASREWSVSAVEDRITAQFEQEVRRKARAAYIDIVRSDAEESAEMRSLYMTEFASGAYNWNDAGANVHNHVRTARKKTWGAFFMLYLLLKRCDPSMTEQLAIDIWLANPNDALSTYLWTLGIPSGNVQSPAQPPPSGAVTDSQNTTNGRATTIPTTQTPPKMQPTFA